MTLPQQKKPTPTQLHMLENLAAGREATHGFPGGRSMSGGLSGTLVSLHRRGWIEGGKITDAGRAALRQEQKAS